MLIYAAKEFSMYSGVHCWSSFSLVCVICFIFGNILSSFFTCLGALLVYHCSLITRGETCIERHINRKNREACKRFKRRFHNPYDFGARQNWRNFLLGESAKDSNINSIISFIVPFDFPPIGDGFTWQEVEQGFIWLKKISSKILKNYNLVTTILNLIYCVFVYNEYLFSKNIVCWKIQHT